MTDELIHVASNRKHLLLHSWRSKQYVSVLLTFTLSTSVQLLIILLQSKGMRSR